MTGGMDEEHEAVEMVESEGGLISLTTGSTAGRGLPEGCWLTRNQGEGDCLFRALAPQPGATHTVVRAGAVRHMRRYQKVFGQWHHGFAAGAGDVTCEWGEDFFGKMSRPGAWGGAIDVAAIAQSFGRAIALYQEGKEPVVFNQKAYRENEDVAVILLARSHYSQVMGHDVRHIIHMMSHGEGARGVRGE